MTDTQDERALRAYLLGDMQIAEQKSIDLWLLSDEESYDLLLAAEDDLMDEALLGTLNERELQQFHHYFLAAPERQRKFRFSRSFRQFLS